MQDNVRKGEQPNRFVVAPSAIRFYSSVRLKTQVKKDALEDPYSFEDSTCQLPATTDPAH